MSYFSSSSPLSQSNQGSDFLRGYYDDWEGASSSSSRKPSSSFTPPIAQGYDCVVDWGRTPEIDPEHVESTEEPTKTLGRRPRSCSQLVQHIQEQITHLGDTNRERMEKLRGDIIMANIHLRLHYYKAQTACVAQRLQSNIAINQYVSSCADHAPRRVMCTLKLSIGQASFGFGCIQGSDPTNSNIPHPSTSDVPMDISPPVDSGIKHRPSADSRATAIPSILASAMPRSILLLLVTLSAAVLSVHAQKSPIDVVFAREPSPAEFNLVDDNFLGISYELSSFDTLWGHHNDSIPTAMQNYMGNIRARMTNPLRIRVGGNGMDASTYKPDLQDRMLELTDPDAYFNDIPTDFGPVLFEVMNGMYDKVGSMQFMIGVSMRDPDNFPNGVELARDAEELLGDRLDAMLLGNEPDLYANHGKRADYNLTLYIPEIGDLISQMEDAGLLEQKRIGGPTVCCRWGLGDVIDAGYDQYPFKYYTLQHYPNHACSGFNEKNTNISYYLSHMNVEEYVLWDVAGVNRAKDMGIPVLLSEYNTVACGGSNISSTFAATLWAVDAGLKSGAANFSAVYLHTREFDIQYNLFDPPSPDNAMGLDWKTGSTYYAALFLAEVTSPFGSVIVDLNLDNSITSPNSTVATYGIYDDGGRSQGKLVLINYDNDAPRTFNIPGNMTDDFVEYRVLTAPDVTERTEITWAGQTVRQNGILEGEQVTTRIDCAGGCTIEVPGPGAALVVLHPSSSSAFFRGNSTIAPSPGSSSGAISTLSTSSSLLATLFALLTAGVALAW
ncbi:hypothetical protein ONZ45_g401 [Pleurotus djamor]|nr:hypothetical protein ONZ45_g401 [Pleurotus djamor]